MSRNGEDGGRWEETSEDLHNDSHSSQQISPSPPPDHDTTINVVITNSLMVTQCIGATRDEEQQKAVEQAYMARQRGEAVPVKIEAEPKKPYDSKAICMVDGSWCRIGYIVREVLDEVHEAIADGHILQVRFAWVKLLLEWTLPGPGFYAGIDVAHGGEWSCICIRSASTKS